MKVVRIVMNNHVHRPQNNNNASNTSIAANWCMRGNTNTASSERSQPVRNPNDQNRQLGTNSANVNLRTINTRRDEYNTVDDLCWDVGGEKYNAGEMLARMTSPRIHAMIADKKVAVLLDSGSEITCVAEDFYLEIKKHIDLLELPVTNLTVYVAVGKKHTTIKRQVQIGLAIGEYEITHPFLVVPGLSTEILVGVDWLKAA